MTGQLDLLPQLDAAPGPHRYSPRDILSWLGPCVACERHQLDEVHTRGGTGSQGLARFFDALDAHSRDRLARTRDALRAHIEDLARIAGAEQNEHDESFKAGVAWGIAALRLALRTAEGETEPLALQLPTARRR